VRLHLAAGVELGVQGLAVRVIPVLVCPAQNRVVGEGPGQLFVVEALDDLAERGGRYRYQVGQAQGAEEARQVERQLVEHELQQKRVPLGRVSGVGREGRCEGPELCVALAVPAARDDRRPRDSECLELLHDDEPVEEGGGSLLDGGQEEALAPLLPHLPFLGRRFLPRHTRPLRAYPFVQPLLEPFPAGSRAAREARGGDGELQPVCGPHRVREVAHEPLAQPADSRGEEGLGFGSEGHQRFRSGTDSFQACLKLRPERSKRGKPLERRVVGDEVREPSHRFYPVEPTALPPFRLRGRDQEVAKKSLRIGQRFEA